MSNAPVAEVSRIELADGEKSRVEWRQKRPDVTWRNAGIAHVGRKFRAILEHGVFLMFYNLPDVIDLCTDLMPFYG